LAVVVGVVSFGVKNMTPTPVRYYGTEPLEAPLFFLLLGAFVLGFFSSWALSLLRNLRLRYRLRKGRTREKELEGRMEDLERQALVPTLTEGEEVKHSPPT
jgi:uncharacterized integral membrane protein